MGTILKKIFCLLFFLLIFSSQSFLFLQVSATDQITDTVKCREKPDRVMLFTCRHNMIIKKAGRSSLFLILQQGEEQVLMPSLRQAENMDSSLPVQTIRAMAR